jgi:hypothetical protein
MSLSSYVYLKSVGLEKISKWGRTTGPSGRGGGSMHQTKRSNRKRKKEEASQMTVMRCFYGAEEPGNLFMYDIPYSLKYG